MNDQNSNTNKDDQTVSPENSFVKDSEEFSQSVTSPVGGKNSQPASDEDIVWSGPEFINHEKNVSWFMLVALIALILGGLFYLLSKDVITTITIALAVIIVGAYGARKPKIIDYKLNNLGIKIGLKQFSYDQFRYFSAINEEGFINITFIPLKRFSPPAGMYYKGDDASKIIDFLSQRMPLQEHKLDIIDSLMQRIRF